MNNSKDKLTRKEFFKRIGILALMPFGFAWFSSVARDEASNSSAKQVKIKLPVNKGVTFKDDVIISRTDNGINFFSSRCTHLGCKLNKIENGKIVCPCHGSKFSLDGKVLSGPANNNLNKLEYVVNNSSKEIIINVPA